MTQRHLLTDSASNIGTGIQQHATAPTFYIHIHDSEWRKVITFHGAREKLISFLKLKWVKLTCNIIEELK